MTRVRVEGFTISLDAYGAGPNQDINNPFGVGGTVNGVECLPVDDGIMPAGMAYALVDYLADIGPVGQQLIALADLSGERKR
jgi:hypothetical protein